MSNRLNLPEPVAAYFLADKLDGDAVARCFTQNAIVKDEGHTYTGLESIERWKSEVGAKFTYTSEPFALEQEDGLVIVTSRLTGNFPGSPTNLRFFFRLEGSKIASLEIIP